LKKLKNFSYKYFTLYQQWFDLLNLCNMYDQEDYVYYLQSDIMDEISVDHVSEIESLAAIYGEITKPIAKMCEQFGAVWPVTSAIGMEFIKCPLSDIIIHGKLHHITNGVSSTKHNWQWYYNMVRNATSVIFTQIFWNKIYLVPTMEVYDSQNHYICKPVLEKDLLCRFKFFGKVNYQNMFAPIKHNLYTVKCCCEECLPCQEFCVVDVTVSKNWKYYHQWIIKMIQTESIITIIPKEDTMMI